MLADNGLHAYAGLIYEVYRLMGDYKSIIFSFHAMRDGGVERVNHNKAQMVVCVVNDRLDE